MTSKYSDDLKARALELYAEHGPAEAHRMLRDDGHEIPKGTLFGWAHRDGVHGGDSSQTKAATEKARARMESKRIAIAEWLLDQASELLDRMDEEQIDFRGKDADKVVFPRANAKDVQSLAIAAAVCIDKSQLLAGEATAINEERGNPLRAREAVEAKLDELASKRAERSA